MKWDIAELQHGNPEVLLAMLRGRARVEGWDLSQVFDKEERDAGLKSLVPFERRRLRMVYDYACMSGVGCPEGMPLVKVAFVRETDSGMQGAGWDILEELGTKRGWCDVHNFGDLDLSGAPAYGSYDIVTAAAPLEALSHYDYLIFAGKTLITEEICDKLKAYVSGGGRLLVCASHLGAGVSAQELFGCRLDIREAFVSNAGVKLRKSLIPEIQYPADELFDPLFSHGYARYPRVELAGGQMSAYLSQSFAEREDREKQAAVVEHQLGAGCAVLLTSLEDPETGPVYPLWRCMVREFLTASHRQCPVKVYGGDKLRFTVYPKGRIYLLNTDFDVSTYAVIEQGNSRSEVTLEPCELRVLGG